jgi:ubiquinone/menaquinone biosynthesis C-methylase UbiE
VNRMEIKDNCREGLIKYSRKAFESLPALEKPAILDLGCGTGIVALELAELTNGKITAVDTDEEALNWFESKVKKLNLENRISIIHGSVFNVKIPANGFDIIIAEGLLNIVGFETGIKSFSNWLKKGGYFIIHDEFKDRDTKLKLIKKYKYELISTFDLDENVWWTNYCSILEQILNAEQEAADRKDDFVITFAPEISEMAMYRRDPSQFKSTYFILKKL